MNASDRKTLTEALSQKNTIGEMLTHIQSRYDTSKNVGVYKSIIINGLISSINMLGLEKRKQ
jgi:hypothetical protein